MKKSKNDLKAEFVKNKKVLEKVKREVAKLAKSAEKDKSSCAREMAKVCQIILNKKQVIEEQRDIVRELVLMGESTENDREHNLFEYVKDGDCGAIASALIDGLNIDKMDKDLWTPLHAAAFNGHESIVEFLLKMGAKADTKNSMGRTPFHVAVGHNQVRVAEIFLESGVNPFNQTRDKKYPQQLATSEQMIELLQRYEEQFIKENINNLQKIRECCDSILLYAVSNKCHSVLPLLVELQEKGEDLGLNTADGKGNTPMHLAVMNDDLKSLDLLISCKPYPFRKNSDRKYPLDLAESPKIKKKLAEYEEEYIRWITGSADYVRQFGNDLLLRCAEKGYTDAVRELLKYSKDEGVDINVSNPDDNTPLHLAVIHRWDDIVLLLLESGAEMLVINKKGLIPADYIDINENKKLVRIFNNYERIWVSRILQKVNS